MASALEMWITGEVSSQKIVASKIFRIKNDDPGSSFFTFFSTISQIFVTLWMPPFDIALLAFCLKNRAWAI